MSTTAIVLSCVGVFAVVQLTFLLVVLPRIRARVRVSLAEQLRAEIARGGDTVVRGPSTARIRVGYSGTRTMAALTDRRLLWFWGRELRELQLSQVREVRAASSYNTEIRMGWSYVIFTATDREVGVALPDGEDQTWLASAIDILGRKAQGAA